MFTALARTPLGSVLRHMPFLEAAYNHRALERHGQSHLLSGIFSSYAQALAGVPRGRPSGWNNEEAAAIWSDCVDPVRPGSYPLFFWLLRLLQPGASIIDYGGSVGLTFYAYHRYARLPEGASWTVVELPLIAAQGQRIAKREGARNLFFTTDISAPEACDILLAAGSLQYMENSVPGLLDLRHAPPHWLLLNKLPLSKGPEFWSLDNFGPAVAPYRVFNEQAFLSYFEQRGYVLRDRWQVAELKCDIAFHPESHLRHHVGLCLERCG
jgi:putative methyltransferase (TIGR04325 family)